MNANGRSHAGPEKEWDKDSGTLSSNGQPHSLTAFHDSTEEFEIADFDDNDGPTQFDGLIDQVRISDTKLKQDSLLIPEPATLALLSFGGLALMRRRCR